MSEIESWWKGLNVFYQIVIPIAVPFMFSFLLKTINHIVKLHTKKDTWLIKPREQLARMLVWIIKSMKGTVMYGASYWFSFSKKETHSNFLKIYRCNNNGDIDMFGDLLTWELQDKTHKKIDDTRRTFDSVKEAVAHFFSENNNYNITHRKPGTKILWIYLKEKQEVE